MLNQPNVEALRYCVLLFETRPNLCLNFVLVQRVGSKFSTDEFKVFHVTDHNRGSGDSPLALKANGSMGLNPEQLENFGFLNQNYAFL